MNPLGLLVFLGRWLAGERRSKRHARRRFFEPLEDRRLLAAVLYVNDDAAGLNTGSSWADAYTDLQSALATATTGDEIWVAAGTYKPTTGTDRTISFNLKEGVSLYGGFAGTETIRDQRDWTTNVTTLSGDIGTPGTDTDNTNHVVYASGVSSATLDGFTITAGRADGPGYFNGGGIYTRESSPTLGNLIIRGNGNSAGSDTTMSGTMGGGLDVYTRIATLTNINFIGNSVTAPPLGPGYGEGGGMSIFAWNAATLTNVTFDSNTATGGGGGAISYGGSSSLEKVRFSGNSALGGGGIRFESGSPALENVIFTGNVAADSGGGMSSGSGVSPIVTNGTFTGNKAKYGGGMSGGASPILANVTFSGNRADYGGAVYYSGSFTASNAIFWADAAGSGAEILANPYAPSEIAKVTYSIIQGGWAGTGNLDVDPLFVDAANGDLHLKPGSPAIDSGTATGAPAFDLDGNRRPLDGDGDGTAKFDMGAYEFKVSNQAPEAEAGGPYIVGVEQSVTLSGEGSSDPDGTITLYEWDLNYDGVTFDVDATGSAPTFSAGNLQLGQTRTVALRVTDNNGALSLMDTATVTAVDVTPPTVTGVSVSDTWLTHADVGNGKFAVAVTYSEPMKALPAPTIAFTADVTGTLTAAGGTWTDATHYTATYDVADANVVAPDVGILVTGAEDAAGNTQVAYTAASAFTIYTIEDTPGLYDPATSTFYLRCSNTTGAADYTFAFGQPGAGWEPLAGDWDGNGIAGVGLYDPKSSTFYLTDACTTGYAQYTFGFGAPRAGWIPLVGDWNGDGRDGVGLYDPANSVFYLTDKLETGFAQYAFGYGEAHAGWMPVAGDWNRDHRGGVGLYDPRGGTFYLTDQLQSGVAQYIFGLHEPVRGWKPLAGDWDGDACAGVGLYDPRASTFYFTDTLTDGSAEYTVGFGEPRAGWEPVVGCWTTAGGKTNAAAVDQIDLASMVAQELNQDGEILK